MSTAGKNIASDLDKEGAQNPQVASAPSKPKKVDIHRMLKSIIFLGDSRDGRDKIYRIVQYLSKFFGWLAKSLSSDPTWFINCSNSFGSGRKLFRLFRSVDFMYKALTVIQFNPSLISSKLFEFLKFLFVALWLLFDSLTYLSQQSLIPKKYSNLIQKPRLYSWLLFLIVDLIRLVTLPSKDHVSIIKTILDIVLPIGYLKLFPLNDGIIGLCGTITSVIGVSDLLKKPH